MFNTKFLVTTCFSCIILLTITGPDRISCDLIGNVKDKLEDAAKNGIDIIKESNFVPKDPKSVMPTSISLSELLDWQKAKKNIESTINVVNPIERILFWGYPPNEPVFCDTEEPELGCFEKKGTFFKIPQRPVNVAPQTDRKLKTWFTIYSSKRNADSFSFAYGNFSEYKQFITVNFDPKLDTKFIIHGFLTDPSKELWQEMMAETIQSNSNFGYNVFVVDWSSRNGFPYGQAAANTRLVGRQVALLAKHLKDQYGADLKRFHCIGHSLGAHTCGYAGDWLNRLFLKIDDQLQRELTEEEVSKLSSSNLRFGRISGLDPAGPYFESTKRPTRLDQTDANLVDIIHTDISRAFRLAFGINSSIGHLDFFPNAGADQPLCTIARENKTSGYGIKYEFYIKYLADPVNSIDLFAENAMDLLQKSLDIGTGVVNIFQDVTFKIGCDHTRSIQLYTDSIVEHYHKSGISHESDSNSQFEYEKRSACQYISYNCDNWEQFENGLCNDCDGSNGNCPTMGFEAELFDPKSARTANTTINSYLKTDGDEPFCALYYNFQLITPDLPKFKANNVRIKLRIMGKSKFADLYLANDPKDYENGNVYTGQVLVNQPLGDIVTTELKLEQNLVGFTRGLFRKATLHVKQLIITEMFKRSGKIFRLTNDRNTGIDVGEQMTLTVIKNGSD